ncbi:hypothetical protein, partial [Salisediminibacterium halotolerans]|uniref:hypothetical protein n=1 Tax=Salisediminibacterium halotolerans TaxID=517425 RepID=UPI001C4322EF
RQAVLPQDASDGCRPAADHAHCFLYPDIDSMGPLRGSFYLYYKKRLQTCLGVIETLSTV